MATTTKPSALHELSALYGIIPSYLDQTGRETRHTSDETRVLLLRALGVDASDERSTGRAIEAVRSRDRDRLLAPTRVVRDLGRRPAAELRMRREWAGAEVEWSLELVEEGGRTHRASGGASGRDAGVLRIPLPRPLRHGYHTLRARVRAGAEETRAEQSLILAPGNCPTTDEVLEGRRAFGVIAQLYTVRSARDWGVGDLGDLAELAAWAGELGAEFVGVNPLHALLNRGPEISPYSPVSRLFRNPLYIDVEAVPELAESDEARALLTDPARLGEIQELRTRDRVDYERVMAAKRPVLEALHRAFVRIHGRGGTPRGDAYRRYIASQGRELRDFSTWMALEEHFRGKAPASSWHHWPKEFRSPSSPAVGAFQEAQRDAIDFHGWMQFELDAQLGAAARRADEAGLRIGLYQDLAIGTSPNGSDTWAFPTLFVEGVSIGAPPDPLAASGQNWGLPPLHPVRLREEGYRYWITLVRAALRHAGALRIDHVMGLFRQFWIPEGKTGKDGAYVRFPAEDLLGILALESTRCGALVVGEDLGTVPPEVPPALESWQILSSRVLYFERENEIGFRPAASYEPRALATANTHDMATLAGWWKGSDLELRASVGQIDEADLATQREQREREKQALVERLRADGVLPAGRTSPTADDIRCAVHDFLCRTPSALVGLSLDDLVGEEEQVNLPGVSPDEYPSWTRRLRESLDRVRADRRVRSTLGCRRGEER